LVLVLIGVAILIAVAYIPPGDPSTLRDADWLLVDGGTGFLFGLFGGKAT
jgi:hypothetical protein